MYDDWTLNHLNTWLENHVPHNEDCRLEVRKAMLALAAEDPAYWHARSWSELFQQAGGDDIVRRCL